MKPKNLPAEQHAIEEVKKRFKTWREVRKKRSRIPEELWQAAVELSSDYSIHKISRTLSLDYSVLKGRILSSRSVGLEGKEAGSGFIELDLDKKKTVEEWVIELEDGKGAKMKMHLKGGVGVDLLELAKSFLGKAR